MRHRVSGILASMKDHQKKRVSGTYWERFLYVALPIPLLALLFFILKNGLTSSWEVALILVAVVLMAVSYTHLDVYKRQARSRAG